MNGLTVVFGSGATGRPIIEVLAARGDRVRVAQRGTPVALPAGVQHVACDVLDADAVLRAVEGATQVVLAVSFPYDSRIWRSAWPTTMANILAGCAASGARLVFIDTLYQLGPQNLPRHEGMPLSDIGGKPAILAGITRMWQAARGEVRVAALCCSDFYGPGVGNAHLGTFALGELAKGKPAQLLVPADTPHDFAYVPDIARAVVTLLDASDEAYGRAWNMPCAPTQTPRELLAIGAAALGQRNRVWAVPLWLMRPLGLVYRFAKEVADVSFTWDRPYKVDASAFTDRFGFTPTPFAVGMPATAPQPAAEPLGYHAFRLGDELGWDGDANAGRRNHRRRLLHSAEGDGTERVRQQVAVLHDSHLDDRRRLRRMPANGANSRLMLSGSGTAVVGV